MRMNIRCCCTPEKILGSVEVPDNTHRGQWLRFPLLDFRALDPPTDTTVEVLSLPAEVFYERGKPPSELALKSQETPMEKLRLIPTFKEHVHGQ